MISEPVFGILMKCAFVYSSWHGILFFTGCLNTWSALE